MAFGIDYITGPPIADMQAAGVTFVCRYLSFVNSLTTIKLLTKAEAAALSSAGISIVSNYEWYATRAIDDGLGHTWTPGQAFNAGVQDGQIAASQHAACGGPPDRPIYFSVDFDTNGSQVAPYFQGVAKTIGLPRTAGYGSYRVLKYLFDNGLIAYGWQTYAWSSILVNGQWVVQWEPRAHIQQYLNGVSMSGHSVDYDRSMQSDFGQWRVTSMIDLTSPGVANFFTQAQMGWNCRQTGKNIHGAILAFYQSFGQNALCGLTYLGLPVSNEIALDTSGAVKQYFERGVLVYDVAHAYDQPPGAGQVYTAHLYSGIGEDPLVGELQTEVGQLKQQLQAATQPTGVDPVKVTERLQAIGLQSHNGDAAIQALVGQAIV